MRDREQATEVRTIQLRRIKAGSVFKLVFLSAAAIFVPLFLFFGVLAFFGAKTVTVSGEHVTGLKGLVAAIIMAPIFSVLAALFLWLGGYVGIRLVGYFRPIEIEYVPATDSPEGTRPV